MPERRTLTDKELHDLMGEWFGELLSCQAETPQGKTTINALKAALVNLMTVTIIRMDREDEDGADR